MGLVEGPYTVTYAAQPSPSTRCTPVYSISYSPMNSEGMALLRYARLDLTWQSTMASYANVKVQIADNMGEP
ncbi:hypothetical protein GCM10027343_21740 [Noviherbaspirillum agri]